MRFCTRYYAIIALLATIAACKEPSLGQGEAEEGKIPQDAVVEILTEGGKLYWGISAMRGTETTTLNGVQMALLDPSKIPSMKALRQQLSGVFTNHAIDSLIVDLGIKESAGKLWIPAADPGDVSVYEDADVTQSVERGDTVLVTVDVPLGDSGQSDLRGVRLVRVGNDWRIDNNPFTDVETADDEPSD
ncbi:MAG: hypothetical protein IPM61_02725 [Chlorobi bacterium]|nr:MAG: hypothetical protein UZ07_CHB004002492 [Chlorobi bacterium OLB7]MBK8910219.1 hypothetical protein [Chlorobiota bacterium]MBX7217190.1 IseA DL-endopeptidase inhibitor family protein [Candidatus Kapabacteria bacterium]